MLGLNNKGHMGRNSSIPGIGETGFPGRQGPGSCFLRGRRKVRMIGRFRSVKPIIEISGGKT